MISPIWCLNSKYCCLQRINLSGTVGQGGRETEAGLKEQNSFPLLPCLSLDAQGQYSRCLRAEAEDPLLNHSSCPQRAFSLRPMP